jgi:hypothetical protein
MITFIFLFLFALFIGVYFYGRKAGINSERARCIKIVSNAEFNYSSGERPIENRIDEFQAAIVKEIAD